MRTKIFGLLLLASSLCYAQDTIPSQAPQDYVSCEPAQVEDEEYDVYTTRQELMLTPPYLASFIGADFFTKENIENDCGVSPMAYEGGKVYDDLSKCPIAIEYNTKDVGISVSFRLFGEDAFVLKKQLLEYGYTQVSVGKVTLLETDYVGTGVRRVLKRKVAGGFSVCEIVEGRAMTFTVYRTKK